MNEMPKVVPDDIYVMNVLRYANINQMVYGQKEIKYIKTYPV